MIGKVTRSADVGGLLRYVFGPGRHNEHTDPHVIATWASEPHDRTTDPAQVRRSWPASCGSR